MEWHSITADQIFTLLSGASQRRNLKVVAIAESPPRPVISRSSTAHRRRVTLDNAARCGCLISDRIVRLRNRNRWATRAELADYSVAAGELNLTKRRRPLGAAVPSLANARVTASRYPVRPPDGSGTI